MSQDIKTFKRKLTLQSVIAFMLVLFGMAIVLLSIMIPPKGEIHPSVITVFGMVLVAAGAFLGIDLNFQFKSFIEELKDKENPKTDPHEQDY